MAEMQRLGELETEASVDILFCVQALKTVACKILSPYLLTNCLKKIIYTILKVNFLTRYLSNSTLIYKSRKFAGKARPE